MSVVLSGEFVYEEQVQNYTQQSERERLTRNAQLKVNRQPRCKDG